MMLLDLAAVFLPLLGAVGAGLFGRKPSGKGSGLIASGAVLAAAVLSALIFRDVALHGAARSHVLGTWLESGELKANWSLKIDTLSALMMLVVNGISAVVHVYSIGYMRRDKGMPRFMVYLSLFTFFMLMLVTSGNLLQLFFGWEGVGLMSYLLIGFWYEKPAANAAAIKAFLVNRAGDAGFLLGIFGCFILFHSVRFDTLAALAPDLAAVTLPFMGLKLPALTTICLLLFLGAMAKSAQIGLHTWLPDAMEGPTPVSALIHAATMVAAGVFMVARLSPLFEHAPEALAVVTVVGAVTAFFAACVALTQFDIKRVIAWSTISQLGYMFLALGVSAYSTAMFHLVTHAFFKALLFLAAGSVIHALGGEQDMRRMGGLWRKTPFTYALMWIGVLALAGIGIDGVFGFSGFYSKDAILNAAYAASAWTGRLGYALGLVTAFMTAFYAGRLVFLTFHGAAGKTAEHAHESPWIMLGPLVPLALGAVFAGWLAEDWFVDAGQETFWNKSLFITGAPQHLPEFIRALPAIMALAGLGLAYVFYLKKPAWPQTLAKALGGVYRAVLNGYYADAAYDALFTRNAQKLGRAFWKTGDEKLIDGYGPDGIAAMAARLGRRGAALQTGYLNHYAFAMVAGLAGLALWAWLSL
ncbi:MAG: NADH-quinone oxidoreductase subunit L [Alphaproteobacteria bacterium]|nr:NADH-quinone oxidoreductase subunit L [Alphaproteobacteria bacterium]